MSQTITLSRAAGDKKMEAQTKFEELESVLQKQMAGELDEDSRLTAEEIAERKQEIEALVREAAEIEGVTDLKEIMRRPADQVSGEARRILAGDDGADAGTQKRRYFKSIGEFMRAVRTNDPEHYDYAIPLEEDQRKALKYLYSQATRLEKDMGDLPVKELGDLDVKQLVGDDSGSSGRGDYLVPTEHMAELLRTMGESQQFVNRARRVPMSRRTADFPRLSQTDEDDDRPMFSFAAVSKIAEGAQKPEREPTFEQLTLTAIKYAAYVEASDELLSDSIVDVPPVLIELLTSAIGYEYDRDGFRGSGSSEPQGFIGSNAEVAVNRSSANEIGTADVFEMESQFFGGEGIYYFHPSAIPQLYALASSNIIVWNGDLASEAPGTLLGRQLVRTHKLPGLGTKGDFCLVDPSFYLAGDLQRVTVASSIHAQFRNDVTAWRATFRAAGTPWPAGTFSHEASSGTKTHEVSPFVVLDVPES